MIACTTASRELKNWLWDRLGDDKRKPGSSSRIGSLRAYQGHQPKAEQRRSSRLAALPAPAASRRGMDSRWRPDRGRRHDPSWTSWAAPGRCRRLATGRTERNIGDAQATLWRGSTDTVGARDEHRVVGYEPPSSDGHAARRRAPDGRRHVARNVASMIVQLREWSFT
jgi:hypothetical protein